MDSSEKLLFTYQKLLEFYGKQNWWPGEGIEIAIGAVLTQQTSWNNVEIALNNLRKANCLSIKCLQSIELSKLEELIRPSGYYRLKAIRLRNLINLLAEKPKPTREELLSVKGIGFETADSILNYLFEKPFFVVDAYTFRIFKRLGIYNKEKFDYNELQKLVSQNIPEDVELYKEFHALLVKHAKETCLKKSPKCNECPLNDICEKLVVY